MLIRVSMRAAGGAARALATSAAAPSQPVPHVHVLLEYVYDAATAGELSARRAPLRPAHLAHANAARARGELVLGGAVGAASGAGGDVAGAAAGGRGLGGLLVFRGVSEETVRAFAAADPYVIGRVADTGRALVRSWTTRTWDVVIGAK
jgi:uncharacterized protein YciI